MKVLVPGKLTTHWIVCSRYDGFKIWGITVNILNKQSDRQWLSVPGPGHKMTNVYLHKPYYLEVSLTHILINPTYIPNSIRMLYNTSFLSPRFFKSINSWSYSNSSQVYENALYLVNNWTITYKTTLSTSGRTV